MIVRTRATIPGSFAFSDNWKTWIARKDSVMPAFHSSVPEALSDRWGGNHLLQDSTRNSTKSCKMQHVECG